MKKKLIAVVALVLIVALTCSLAACNNSKSMFDGNFKKEATQEEASSQWKTAQTAFGEDSAELATASEPEETIKGWKGMTVCLFSDLNFSGVSDGKKVEETQIMQAEGSLLFDGSAMAMTIKMGSSSTEGDKTESRTSTVGTYVKDTTMYATLGLSETKENNKDDKSLNLKFGEEIGLIGGVIQSAIGGVAEQYSEMVVDALGDVICDMTYDELLKEYDGFKAYVDNSGKYNRVKYVLTAEMIADLNNEDEDFVKNAVLGECSIIIVTDKETNSLQGVKFEINTTVKTKEGEDEITVSTKSTVSMENCNEVTSFPSDLDTYKDVKDLTEDDLKDFNLFG